MSRHHVSSVLRTLALCLLLLSAPAASRPPALSLPVTHGVAAGNVTSTSAVIWSRTDRDASMHVLLRSTTEHPHHTTRVHAASDYAGYLRLTRLSPNTTYHYTVWFTAPPQRHSGRPAGGVDGTFRTPPLASEPQAVTFAWGGDLAGQNVCRDATEGFTTVQAVNALVLDFFIGLGDII